MSTSVGNGTGGGGGVLMPSDGDDDNSASHAPEDQRFLPWLPLLEGYVYDGDAIDSGNLQDLGAKPAKRLQPIVLFKRTNLNAQDATQRWRHAESSGLTADLASAGWDENQLFSAHVRVDNDDGALWVSIHDGFNHLIASADFTPLPTDDAEFLANFRTDMIATLAVPWSQYAEAKYPKTPPAGDGVRRVILEVPNYRVDYVVPNTVVALDANGTLLRTDTGGYIRDDRDELKAIARIAFEWYGKTRRAVSFSTSLVNNRLQLGDYIASIGDPDLAGDIHTDDVRSVITQITINMPLAEGHGAVVPQPPHISYETAFGELDALRLAKRHFR